MKSMVIMSGLPCTGKSTLSDAIARELKLPIFSVDPIEAALWRSGLIPSHETGVAAYEVAAALAEEHLKLGQSVIIDAVNGMEIVRARWREIARAHNVRMIVIETTCPDIELHRSRVDKRVRNIPGMPELSWDTVEARIRDWVPWIDERLVVDSRQPSSYLIRLALDHISNSARR